MSEKRITGTIVRITTTQTARHGIVTNVVIDTIGHQDKKKVKARGWNNTTLANLKAGALVQVEGSWSFNQADRSWDLVIQDVSEIRKIDPATVDVSKYL